MAKQHYERQDQASTHDPPNALVWVVVLSSDAGIACLFAEFLCLLPEQTRGVSLLEEEECGHLQHDVENGCGVEYPAPVSIFGNVGAANGGYGRRYKGQETINRLTLAALLFPPRVCQYAIAKLRKSTVSNDLMPAHPMVLTA